MAADSALLWAADHATWGTVRRLWRPDSGASAVASAAPDLWAVEDAEDEYTPEEYTLLCPIRFQGQWEDAETELYYNRFRYFDTYAGCYNARDRLGIWGGLSAHGYVERPNSFVDPKGLRGVRVTPGGSGSCADFVLELSSAVYPETAGHISDAIANGQPQTVTVDRPGAPDNRRELRPGRVCSSKWRFDTSELDASGAG